MATYGTQSDAYAATHDLHHRDGGKERKLSAAAIEGGSVSDADELLAAMGYKAELVRTRSTLQVAFMSFVLASIPYGLSTTFFYPLAGGGPANIIWGFFGVSLIILCVATSLGEITSVFPTAGGVYYQTWMLSAPSYRRIASWVCGWSFVVGNITITLAVNFGTALFLGGCINVFGGDDGIFEANTWQIYLIFLGITLLCNAVSAFGNRWLPWLDVSNPFDIVCAATHAPTVDIRHLLDLCRCDCNCSVRSGHRERRAQ
jgi:amino acid transporter